MCGNPSRLSGGCAAVLATLLAGCVGSTIRVSPPDLPDALVEALPLKVGVYLSPDARDHSFKDKTVTGARFEVGAASTVTLISAFHATFAEVVELADPSRPPPDVDAVLELVAIDWSTGNAAEGYSTSAHYAFVLNAPDGGSIGEWATTQRLEVNETAVDPGHLFDRNLDELFEAPAAVLVEKVAAAFLREFREEPGIRQWLDGKQAFRPVLPRPDPDGAAPAPAPTTGPVQSGILVTSEPASDPVRRCVFKELRTLLRGRPIVSSEVARRTLYPWLSDRPPPATALARLAELSRYAPAQARIDELGLGVVILIKGGTTQDWHGGGVCGGGFGAGGCLGLTWGERDSLIAAQLLDLSRPDGVTQSEAQRKGTAVVPMFILPLPFIPATQSAACHELAKALAAQLEKTGTVSLFQSADGVFCAV